jgi:NADPH:quinone reductase-like Zn-dependent oxidoreductase
MVIRLGKHYGFKTINVVRRREQADELRLAGGDEVVCTADESVVDRVRAITKGAGVPYALDAVGGATGSAAVQALGAGGRLLVYGTLSEEPIPLHPRVLMVGNKRVEGFWMAEWARAQGMLTMLGLFRRLGKLIEAGVLASEVGAVFPLDQIKAAVKEAGTAGRQGKVLLRIGQG